MSDEPQYEPDNPIYSDRTTTLGLTVALVALAALGVGLAVQQVRERKLSKPEMARLKFYRYLREKGHLES